MGNYDAAYGAAINAALAIYMKKQADKAPKTYAVPLTPEDQWKADQQKSLYGSLGNYVGQYLQNGQQTPDFKFHSDIFKGDKFAGGLTMPQIDYSKVSGPLGTPAAPAAGAAPAVDSAIPPPPPPITVPTGKKKINNVAKGALGGLVGGAVTGGGVGGVIGAVTGGLGGRSKNEDAWKKGYEEFNKWKAQYASAFTDANGKLGHAPETLEEYKKWYEKKYGVPYVEPKEPGV